MILAAKQNPFSVQRTTSVPYRFAVGDWSFHLKKLYEFDCRAAIVGPRGTGKSTLLRDLEVRLIDSGQECVRLALPQDTKNHQAVVVRAASMTRLKTSILLVDGIERLSPWLRLRLLRCERVVATFHRSLALSFFRMPVWMTTETDQRLLEHLLDQLDVGADTEIQSEARRLFTIHGGNLREVLRDLYDQAAIGRYVIDSHVAKGD